MRIDIDKDGKEQVTLTKAEQATLGKAKQLCESIGKHSDSDEMHGEDAAKSLEFLIDRYCKAGTEAPAV